jgi:hypothetical protein
MRVAWQMRRKADASLSEMNGVTNFDLVVIRTVSEERLKVGIVHGSFVYHLPPGNAAYRWCCRRTSLKEKNPSRVVINLISLLRNTFVNLCKLLPFCTLCAKQQPYY